MNPTTRRATPADIPALVGLMREFYAEAAYPLDDAWAAASFAALLAEPAFGAVWLAARDGAAVGHAVLTVRHSMEFGARDGFIDDLFVRPTARRQGVGNALLRELFAEAKKRELRALHVEVSRDNAAAHGLYARFGLKDRERQRLTVTL
ncbi:MAG: GNAT family N-acetyltransferase [Opitutus sp.]|nr:GNAT family N-acetyltransferase [Opitutus sp.]